MNKFILVLATLTFTPLNAKICFYYVNKGFSSFYLNKLQAQENEQVLDFTLNNVEGKLHIDLCKNLELPKACSEKFDNANVYFLSQDERDCTLILSSDKTLQDKEPYLKSHPTKGFIIKPKDTTVQIVLECDPNADADYSIDKSTSSVKIMTSDGCGKFKESARYFDQHSIILGVSFILLGLFMNFFGGVYWEKLYLLIIFIIGLAFTFYFFWTYTQAQIDKISYTLIYIVAFCSGIFLCYVCYTLDQFSYLFVGFFQGYFIMGNIVNNFGIQQIVKIGINIFIGLIFGLICLKVKERIMINVISFTGSLVAVFMTLYLCNIVDNPMDQNERIMDHQKIRARFLPLLLAVPLAVIGIIIQMKIINKRNLDEKEIQEVLV